MQSASFLSKLSLCLQAGFTRVRSGFPLGCVLAIGFLCTHPAQAAFTSPYSLSNFTLTNSSTCSFDVPNGSVSTPDNGATVVLTGSNSGSGCPGTTDLVATAAAAGMVQFQYMYSSLDNPGYDFAGYLLGSMYTQLTDTSGDSGSVNFNVAKGQSFGFRVGTADNQYEPGILTVSAFSGPTGGSTGPTVPEPGTFGLAFASLASLFWFGSKTRRTRRAAKVLVAGGAAVVSLATLPAQTPNYYSGANVTGQLVLTAHVNLSQLAGGSVQTTSILAQAESIGFSTPELRSTSAIPARSFHSPRASRLAPEVSFASPFAPLLATSGMQSLPIINASGVLTFPGLTHYDQRNANGGNQFSVEPPSPSLGVGNGFVLEGVNNAVRVYDTTGKALLATVSTNQLFAVSPAINRSNGVNGVFPTDMRVFYDASINRFMVLQRAQDNDAQGNTLSTSHIYMAVSTSGDPTQNYNVYTIDTTNANKYGCPCFRDYLQVGADQYGFYISADEYDSYYQGFVDTTILAISKSGLAAGLTTPTVSQFLISLGSGYEFALQPATTPPGASYFVAGGGLEYFVSSQSQFLPDSNLALWAMTNTASLAGGNPNPTLTQILVPVLSYSSPDLAAQKPGPLPYGSTQGGTLPYLDGSDARVQSLSYSGGRLFATLQTAVSDENNKLLVGGAYVIMSPSLRSNVLSAQVLRQGYLLVKGESLLRPAVAVNAQGNGAIAFTLSGTDYYPSAAFVPFNVNTTGPAVEITALGQLPEDGFSAYPGQIARWGDYSTAVAAADGSIWMGMEWIPNTPRTTLANWGTSISQYKP